MINCHVLVDDHVEREQALPTRPTRCVSTVSSAATTTNNSMASDSSYTNKANGTRILAPTEGDNANATVRDLVPLEEGRRSHNSFHDPVGYLSQLDARRRANSHQTTS
jgi:hypothetical protein